MKAWLRWIAGAMGLSLAWAVAWGAIGAVIRMLDPGGAVAAIWLGPEIGMAPGFLGGVLFSLLIAIVASGRGLAASPPAAVVTCGAVAGLAVGVLPFAINQPPSHVPLWQVGAVVIGSMAVLGAVSAGGSQAMARSVSAARR